jgi:hypothetical protein
MTIQISKSTYKNILVILEILTEYYDTKEKECLGFTSKKHLAELVSSLSDRTDAKSLKQNPNMLVYINPEEAADILRACWDTKRICSDSSDLICAELSCENFRLMLNDIASVLCSVAELEY